jgi:von Willebrand factor type A domain
MGFLDYAWAISVQKDNQKVRILQDSKLTQPILERDKVGFTIKLPTVQTLKDGQLKYLGQKFPANPESKVQIGRLFRASVLHLTAHTLVPLPIEKIAPSASDTIVGSFAKSLVRDMFVNACLRAWYPDRFVDIAYANAWAYQKIKSSERIFASSTKVMTSLLTRVNVGLVKGTLETEEEKAVNESYTELSPIRDVGSSSLAGEKIKLETLEDNKVKTVTSLLEPFGPFMEAPSFRHTEQIGGCSIYTETETPSENIQELFWKSIEALGYTIPKVETIEQCWRPEQDAEALQAFNSDQNQKERREKIMAKIRPYIEHTRFKSVDFPDEDYTQYLRAKKLIQGTSRRLLDALRSALNYLDEDPRQEMGQLDLSAVIQAVASKKPATDVFILDEYLKQSFAWSIVVDVSNSMQVKGEYGRALAIAVAEAAKELMMDATSWTFFGFSDRFFILKDSSESYSQRVKARIGGLKFEGLTYIPDAIRMAGKMLAKRFEDQRILVAISDGWPYGYPNMSEVLKENVDELLKKGVIVIGIGVETDRMGNFFRLNSSVYTPKDLVKKFASVYMEASRKALET